MNQDNSAHRGGGGLGGWLAGLVARYDERLLQASLSTDVPALGVAALEPAQVRAWQSLQAWCLAGAGPGRSPPWCPWAPPAVERRWSVAVLTGGGPDGRARVAEALCRELDGALLLAACRSRAAGLALRLKVKLSDAAWWRARRPADPWDSGYLRADSNVTGALAGFVPRRATLIVMVEPSDDLQRTTIAQLSARRAAFRHPVRLLIVAAAPGFEPGAGPGDRHGGAGASGRDEAGDFVIRENPPPDRGPGT